uniref:Uncharacterized protein n=1 Tax=Eutreptiella gymnastica TaxID=73025 RepID=A0A7S1IHQ0_9EUGL|mmetsp:Transcript_18491/g.32818  ORF Transcript_18491/g.32818 Transcript_18491/m.32818 type:complete len:108 (+) Transcript_18491:107-430(+)
MQARGGICVCLDENAKQMTSEDFSEFVYQQLEQGGSRCTFVIGGADGLPMSLRPRSYGGTGLGPTGPQMLYLSLSKMTFVHQFARVVLVEQLYRATQIRNGTKYHRA